MEVAVEDGMRRRFVNISDEAWHAVLTQASAEVRLLGGAASSPGVVVDRALRKYFGLDSNTDDTAATIARRPTRRRKVKGGEATEGA